MTVSLKTWLRNWKSIVSVDYVKDRMDLNFFWSVISQSVFERKHPMYPWITVDMVNILENIINKNDIGFEFGSGNSTIWFAKNSKNVTSVEHDLEWYGKVKQMIQDSKLEKKVIINFASGIDETKMTGVQNYIKPILKIKNNSLDYCFVDGIFRDECILIAIEKLKSGGLLIVDNVDNYFPKNKISISVRYKRDNMSKTVSKTKMKLIYNILNNWRCIWTTSGVQDTALWVKP